jgi:hypothetical protein
MDKKQRIDLDRHITGNWGEDFVADDPIVTLRNQRERNIKHLENIGQLSPKCQGCKEHYSTFRATGHLPFAPSHKAADACESGKHPHCTCDWCF